MNNVYPIFEEILNSEKGGSHSDDLISEEKRVYTLPDWIIKEFRVEKVSASLNVSRESFICYSLSLEGLEWFKVSLILKYSE